MMILKQARALSLAVACVAAMVPLGAGAAPAAVSTATPAGVDATVLAAAPAGPVVATGRLTDGAGHPAAGTVAGLAWPGEQFQRTLKPGDSFRTPTVGSARAGGDGTFSLRIDPRRLPAGFESSTGQVNLNLVAWAGGMQGETSMSIKLGGPTAGTATIVSATGPAKTTRVDLTMNHPLVAASATSAPLSSAAGPATPSSPLLWCGYYWVYVSYYDVWTHAGESLPWSYYTSAGFDMSSSNSMSLGVAYSQSGGWGSFSASGSYNVSSGVQINWNGSNNDNEYDVQTRYGRYVLRNSCGGGYNYQYRESPMYDTGGYRTIGQSYPWWGNCVPAAGNTRWQRNWSSGYNFDVGGGVSIYSLIGLNLNISTAWSGSYDQWYQFTYNSYLCGNNGVPSQASRVEEG